ncbi:phosphodiester glycosidase family protein [Cytophaga aurantiaca]|uniref:phosphodiester glycosidase family protein n=1 Tax=Cytophaga aurantiaca TaxID=29530 RepID=UPI000475F49D|nr:phosphodiester glycosidase family protein [Cytophaga aurantiaca]
MGFKRKLFCSVASILLLMGLAAFTIQLNADDDTIISYTVDPAKQDIQLYWKNDQGQTLKSIQNLKTFVESKNSKLIFAANAGMYKEDNTPLGLFIQNGKILAPLNTKNASGNFYLKPNGVFYITTDKKAVVCETDNFSNTGNVKFATQSGPMLLLDGHIHSAFVKGSNNLNIRNGVGILPNGNIVFAMTKTQINFYDFASYFQRLGCKNALYLDGFVSRTYLPEKHWMQTDGNFGVMVGVTEKK